MKPELFRSAVVTILAVILYGGGVTSLAAKEITAEDLSPDSERVRGGLAAHKNWYLKEMAAAPPLPIEELVAKSASARQWSKAFYAHQIVLRSAKALPLLQARLTEPGFKQLGVDEQAGVFQDLSLLGDPSSVPPILALIDESENLINQLTWQTLLFTPANEAAMGRALVITAKAELPFYLRYLPSTYLAINRVEIARPIALAMLESNDLEEQAAGIWILGYLGDDIRKQALEILAVPDLIYGPESGPLDALAEQAGPDEMRKIVPAFRQGGESWHTAIDRSTLLHASPKDPGERTVLCYKMVRADMPLPWDVTVGLDCLLELGRLDLILLEILNQSDPRGSLLLSILQRRGWQMMVTDNDVLLEKK